MKEVEKKDVPEVSGGELDTYGNQLPAMSYPIVEFPAPQQPDPLLIIPETPLP